MKGADELDSDEATSPIRTRQQIETVCLRLLARREHSRRELLEKLSQRGLRGVEAEAVIDDLAERNWQNDERYTESYVRQRIAKGYGPIRIGYELQQRGIAQGELDAEAEAQGGWLELARAAYLGKYGDEITLPANEWAKRSRFLQQRGFSGETIKHLFAELKIKLNSRGG